MQRFNEKIQHPLEKQFGSLVKNEQNNLVYECQSRLFFDLVI